MDLRALTPAVLVTVLGLVACGGPGSGAAGTADTFPGSVRYDQHVAAGAVAAPAVGLANPLQGDPQAARQGEALFGTMNCDGCHAAGAVGFVGPSLVDGRWRYGGDDGALFHSIFYGRPRGMPAYGGILSGTTIWQLVTYLRSLPVPKEVPTITWP